MGKKFRVGILILAMILITGIVAVFLMRVHHKPIIMIENMALHSVNENIVVPFDLKVYLNDEKVFDDSVNVHVFPQFEIIPEFKFGYNCLTAYSLKAKLYDRYCGFIFLNKRIEIRFTSSHPEGIRIPFLEIGRWPPY